MESEAQGNGFGLVPASRSSASTGPSSAISHEEVMAGAKELSLGSSSSENSRPMPFRGEMTPSFMFGTQHGLQPVFGSASSQNQHMMRLHNADSFPLQKNNRKSLKIPTELTSNGAIAVMFDESRGKWCLSSWNSGDFECMGLYSSREDALRASLNLSTIKSEVGSEDMFDIFSSGSNDVFDNGYNNNLARSWSPARRFAWKDGNSNTSSPSPESTDESSSSDKNPNGMSHSTNTTMNDSASSSTSLRLNDDSQKLKAAGRKRKRRAAATAAASFITEAASQKSSAGESGSSEESADISDSTSPVQKGNEPVPILHRRRAKKPKPSSNGKLESKYRGVSWHRRDHRWLARLWVKGKIQWLGAFPSETQAALAVDLRALREFGPGAQKLNFPDSAHRAKLLAEMTPEDAQAVRDPTPANRKRAQLHGSAKSKPKPQMLRVIAAQNAALLAGNWSQESFQSTLPDSFSERAGAVEPPVENSPATSHFLH